MDNTFNGMTSYYLKSSRLATSMSFFLIPPILFSLIHTHVELPHIELTSRSIYSTTLFMMYLSSVEDLFFRDQVSGSLDIIRLNTTSIYRYAYSKFVLHYLVVTLPLLLITPIVGLFIPMVLDYTLLLYILVTCLLLNSIGFIGSALVLTLRHRLLLLYLISFPLYIPIYLLQYAQLLDTITPVVISLILLLLTPALLVYLVKS